MQFVDSAGGSARHGFGDVRVSRTNADCDEVVLSAAVCVGC
jgi:hypothetical protein